MVQSSLSTSIIINQYRLLGRANQQAQTVGQVEGCCCFGHDTDQLDRGFGTTIQTIFLSDAVSNTQTNKKDGKKNTRLVNSTIELHKTIHNAKMVKQSRLCQSAEVFKAAKETSLKIKI